MQSPYGGAAAAHPGSPPPGWPLQSPQRATSPALNPRIVFVDLLQSDSGELRRALEQLARALEGRLDAHERNQERLVDVLRKYNAEAQETYGCDLARLIEHGPQQQPELNRWASAKLQEVRQAMFTPAPAPPAPDISPRGVTPSAMVRALYVVAGAGPAGPPALAALRSSLTEGGHAPNARSLGTAIGSPPATPEAVAEGLRWLLEGAQAGQALLFAFIGASSAEGLQVESGEVPRHILHHWLVQRVPAGARLTALLDCGDRGTPMELPYSVVAHRGPHGGFEMTRGEPPLQGGQAVLVSTCSDAPGSSAVASATGVLTHCVAAVLSRAPRPQLRDVLSSLRADLTRRLGEAAPLALVSSNRPFHPESVLDCG